MRPFVLMLPYASISLALPSLLDSILSPLSAPFIELSGSPAQLLSSPIGPSTEARTASSNETQWSTTIAPPTTVSLTSLLALLGIGRQFESVRVGKYMVSVSIEQRPQQPQGRYGNTTWSAARVETQAGSRPLWMSFLRFYTMDELQPDVLVYLALSKTTMLFDSGETIWRTLSYLLSNHGPEVVALCIFIILPVFLLGASSAENIWAWFIPERFPERGRDRVRLDAAERDMRLWARYEREMVLVEKYGDCWWRQARRFRR